jgi:hypothetical protein
MFRNLRDDEIERCIAEFSEIEAQVQLMTSNRADLYDCSEEEFCEAVDQMLDAWLADINRGGENEVQSIDSD